VNIILSIIGCFIHHCGIEVWPKLLEIVRDNINEKKYLMLMTRTLIIILEETKSIFVEDKCFFILESILDSIITQLNENNNDMNFIKEYVVIITLIIETSTELVYFKMNEIISILNLIISNNNHKNNNEMNFHLSRCMFYMLHINKKYLYNLYNNLISFYLDIFIPHNDYIGNNYAQCLMCVEFFLFIITDTEQFIKHDKIKNALQNHIYSLVPLLVIHSTYTQKDYDYINNKYDCLTSNTTNNNNEQSLRRRCALTLETLGTIYPQETFTAVRNIIENDIQSKNNSIKERSLLAFGAIAKGCYFQVFSHLNQLIHFIIRELQHTCKYIRAISCWTLSKYTKYIVNDNPFENKNELFKEYLTEILKKLLDKETIVRESATSALDELISYNKQIIEPFLYDVFKVIGNIFDNFTGVDLLCIYDLLIIIINNYNSVFKYKSIVDDVIKHIVTKWYELVKGNEKLNEAYDIISLPYFIEVVICLIRVQGDFLLDYLHYFLTGSLKIIEINVNNITTNINDINKDLFTQTIELLSNIIQFYPCYIKECPIKKNILYFIFNIMKCKDLHILHYTIVLIGDLILSDKLFMLNSIDKLFEQLIPLIYLDQITKEKHHEIISVCNNSIWVLGIMCASYKEKADCYINTIITKISNILITHKEMHKSLAQNISICLGKIALYYPEKINEVLDIILKPFCISLRFVKDSPEKTEAFCGISKAILYKVENILSSSFSLFIDTICLYDNPSCDIENLFKKIIHDLLYNDNNCIKERFLCLYSELPLSLQNKLSMKYNNELNGYM
jgi:hypothetical protein